MADLEQVRSLALALPETSERLSRGSIQWRVKDKLFVWERPLGKKDRADLGDGAPGGLILGARVEHELAKRALIEDAPDVFFTIPHFDGYPAILVRMDAIDAATLEEVVTEAWLCRAPPKLADQFNAGR
jgi:hypothetical protein